EPGLTDILIGTTPAREAIRPEVAPKLDVLPAGSSPPNPSELLGSDAMHALLGEVRREYDYIVVDTPPVLPVTDATVIATIADAIILTIRSGETEELPAQRAAEQLRRVHARIAGVVLNGVDTRRDRHYGYYRYRRNVPYAARSPVLSLRRRLARLF
ncbi:MAG: CpsD/CapB family tyrosine-protein kinase, partial [Gemmatimonadota bacterium]|nr:CpsD/CapB family tyrosine-protein kinase [Gemmatimonadota bacterium]